MRRQPSMPLSIPRGSGSTVEDLEEVGADERLVVHGPRPADAAVVTRVRSLLEQLTEHGESIVAAGTLLVSLQQTLTEGTIGRVVRL